MLLGDILVKTRKVSRSAVDKALALQESESPTRRLGEILISMGVAGELDVLAALGTQLGLEVLEEVPDEMIDPELIRDVPIDWVRARNVLPVSLHGEPAMLTAEPTRVEDQDDLALILGKDPLPILAPVETIRKSIQACYLRKPDSASDILDDLGDDAPTEKPKTVRSDDLLRSSGDAPVTRLVNMILLEALKVGASDIHLEPFQNKLSVRYRIDGLLYEQPTPPRPFEAGLISRLKVMGHLDIAEKRLPQDGAARVRVGEREIDIRISTVPVVEGERIVLRLLNRDDTILPMENLGMSSEILASFRRLLKEPHGVVFVTGPTGSGKTTTLYSAIQELDTQHRNVMTVEDPVEYQLPEIGQINVKPKIGLTFSQGLRHILRQDPDVVLVGETRDLETAEIVVRASLTGHMVFSTLHTNDAVGALSRLADMGIEPHLVASSVRACLAQRLVRRLCEHCKTRSRLDKGQLRTLGAAAANLRGRDLWNPVGCPSCIDGYSGRIGIYEMLMVTPELSEAVREGRGPLYLARLSGEAGMRSLLDDGLDKVLEGLIAIDELVRVLGPGSFRSEEPA